MGHLDLFPQIQYPDENGCEIKSRRREDRTGAFSQTSGRWTIIAFPMSFLHKPSGAMLSNP
jgi:hypothetical protein